jgi:NAD(P)H-hydrate repair Nnr-like enzyme with NAD(P)H-hydrate dehydratase domain
MADAADELYAVRDGKPARAYGGTGDVVAYAPASTAPRCA